jgi:hypothetical protein
MRNPSQSERNQRHRPSAAAGRRSRYLPIILGAVTGIVLCIAALVALLAINRPPPSPAATAGAICTDLRTADYTSLYAALAPSLQQQGTNPQAEFSASQQELDIVSGRVTSCSYLLPQVSGQEESVTYSIARGGQVARPAKVLLVYQNGRWRIQNYDTNMI